MQNEAKEPETNDAVSGRVDLLVMRHDHDCSRCKPLGQFKNNDIYFCDEAEKTVVVRYGSRPEEYYSGIYLTGMPVINIAVEMAKAAKLIDV